MSLSSKKSSDRAGHVAKMLTVLRREFISRIRTKGFIIGTILMPVFIVVISVVPALLATLSSDETKTIAVIDFTNEIYDGLVASLADTNEAGEPIYVLTRVSATTSNLEEKKRELASQIEDGDLSYFLIVPADINESGRAELYGKSVSNFRENRELESAVTRAVVDQRLLRSGLEPESVRRLLASVELATLKIGAGGEEQEEPGFTIVIAWVMVFFLYIAMVLYGAIIMRSVIEEKTSRVIESVVSSVKPFYLMAGKLLGVGAVGFVQFVIWAAVAGLVSLYGAAMVGMFSGGVPSGTEIPAIPLFVLFYFILFFVLGYFFYATLYAGVGSMVNSDQEAQQLAMPVTMFLIVSIMILWYVISNPASQASVILSLIPFFSPMIMFARIVVQTPPAIEILASLALLVLALIGNIWLVGKIFRVGVLMYGKRPTLPEIIKWIRYA